MLIRAFRQHAAPAAPMDRGRLIKAIHATARQLGMDDEARWQLQQGLTGCASCRDMTVEQLRTVASRLRFLAHEAGLGRRGDGATRGRSGRDERLPLEPPTKDQLDELEHRRSHVRLYSSQAWMALCLRVIQHPWPQTRAEAGRMIECLKAMERRGWTAREVQ